MAKVGRPKQDVVKEKVVSVRMSQDQIDRLKEYAKASKKTVTEVILEGVNEIISNK